jgi:predicted transposase YbfD/YdcC
MVRDLIAQLEALDDPRCDREIEHKLVDVLVIAVCAVIAAAESFEAIALYGRGKRLWLEQFLELPNGSPSHDTFRRVLRLIDPDAFERCFLRWVRAAFGAGGIPAQVASDGEVARRSFDRRPGRSPLHLVSAFAAEHGLVLAQRAVGDKRGELSVPPELLEGLQLEGCLVSFDALGLPARDRRAGRGARRGGDDLITLKANHRRAYGEVRDGFAAHAFARDAPLRPCADAFDGGHGRLVRRRVFACPEAAPLRSRAEWPKLGAVLAVETSRGVSGAGRVTAEIRSYVSSAKTGPERLAEALRRHWAIENGWHWVLDVGLGEDASRVRERNAARHLAVLRRIALNLARADASLKASLKGQRKYAAWDDAFMAKLIAG